MRTQAARVSKGVTMNDWPLYIQLVIVGIGIYHFVKGYEKIA
jgi:hypothetical protein